MVDAVELSALLPYEDLFKNGVMRLTGNGLMGMIEYRGINHELTPNNALLGLSNRVGAYLSNFARQGGWTVNVDTCIVEAAPYLSGSPWLGGKATTLDCSGVARFLHDFRQERFAGQLSDERSFISITMRPPRKKARWLEKAIKKGGPEKKEHWIPYLESFTKPINAIVSALKREYEPHGLVRALDANAVLRFMSFAINGIDDESLRFPSGVTDWPFHELMDRLLLMGRQVRIDGRPIRHVRTVGIKGSPPHHTPEMLAALMQVGHPMRISQRFNLIEARGVHDHYRRGIKLSTDQQKSMFTHFIDAFPTFRGRIPPDPIQMAETILSTSEAQGTARIQCGGTLTTSAIIYADTWQEADEKADAVAAIMKNQIGFDAEVENANSSMAFIGSFPGELARNKRCNTLPDDFLARRMRVSAPWPGKLVSQSPWGGAPLIQAVTEGNRKFLFDLFGHGWGHVVGFGPNGSAKSTFFCDLGISWLGRFKHGKVIQFDADSALSTSVVATLAAGGTILSMTHGGVAIQPLRGIDDPDVFVAKHAWLISICAVQGISSPELSETITNDLRLLMTEPPRRWTMNQLYRLAGSPMFRKALAPYAGDGVYASILNGTSNPFKDSPWTLLELGRFADPKNGSPLDLPIIEALLYEAEQAIDAETPTLLIIDEAKLTVRAMTQERAINYAARMRKRRAALAFVFHFIDEDMANLVAALREQCAWRLFFINENAMDESARKWMGPMGVTPTMAQQLARAPKGFVLGIHGSQATLFDLALSPTELAICGMNGKEANEEAVELFNRVGPERFWIEHLRLQGFEIDESKYLEATSAEHNLALAG